MQYFGEPNGTKCHWHRKHPPIAIVLDSTIRVCYTISDSVIRLCYHKIMTPNESKFMHNRMELVIAMQRKNGLVVRVYASRVWYGITESNIVQQISNYKMGVSFLCQWHFVSFSSPIATKQHSLELTAIHQLILTRSLDCEVQFSQEYDFPKIPGTKEHKGSDVHPQYIHGPSWC